MIDLVKEETEKLVILYDITIETWELFKYFIHHIIWNEEKYLGWDIITIKFSLYGKWYTICHRKYPYVQYFSSVYL